MASALPPSLTPLTVPRDALRPPSADNAGFGLGMSVVAHTLLVAALTLGVQWRTKAPEGVSAELWATVPQVAAPPRQAEPTPPQPPAAEQPTSGEQAATQRAAQAAARQAAAREAAHEAEIATEKAERERRDKARREAEAQKAKDEKLAQDKADKAKAEKEKAAQEKAAKDKAARDDAEARKKAEAAERAKAERDDKERARADEAQREKIRQDQLRRMQQQLGGGPSGNGAAGSTGTAAREAGPSAGYAGRIKARIKPNIVLTDEPEGNPEAEVEVKVAPDGTILSRRIVKPSGHKAWDEAVLRAIDRTQVLPRDTDGRIPAAMVIAFRPRE